MAAQMLTINDSAFALIPKAEYQELLARANGVRLPQLPPPNERGNYPAQEAIRLTIARDLIVERLDAGWTQEQLAHKAHVSTETISRLECGRHKPQAATLDKIERAFQSG